MIIINVTYTIKEGKTAKDFLDALNEQHIPESCRAEEGNICYDYFYPADGSNTLLLVENWQYAESLDAHQKMPHFIAIAPIKDLYVADTKISIAKNNR